MEQPQKKRGEGEKSWKIYETKKPKSIPLANNTRGLITTKQTNPRPVSSVQKGRVKMEQPQKWGWRGI